MMLIDRTGATLSMRLPLGKYTAAGEAAAEGSRVLLEEATVLSRMLQRELLAPPQGGEAGTSNVAVALTVVRGITTRGRVATRKG